MTLILVTIWLGLTSYWVDKVYVPADAVDECEGFIQSGAMDPGEMQECVSDWFVDVEDA